MGTESLRHQSRPGALDHDKWFKSARFVTRFADRWYAPVGIRTRAPGSTGRDHRPLDHRGSGRRKVRSLIILSYRDESARGLAFEKTSFRVRAAGRSGQCVLVAWGWSLQGPLSPFIDARSCGSR